MSTLTILDVDPLAPSMLIWYLDHDPVQAAKAVPDPLLSRAIIDAARLLCAVWHAQEPEKLGAEWVPPTAEVVPYTPPEELSSLVTKLHGQRVYNSINTPAATEVEPYVAWAGASAANYSWLWRYGWHLTHEYSVRLGLPHGAMPVLWVLEWPPECLDAKAGATEAPTLVRTRETVAEDGEEYVDAVASHRAYLLKYRSHVLRWTKGEPSWLSE